MAPTTRTPLSARKATLLTQREMLGSRLASIETELQSHVEPDWEDLATRREDDEVLESSGMTGLHSLRQIDAALARIEAGTYGTCAKCGDAIAEARLDALPATPFCATCASGGAA